LKSASVSRSSSNTTAHTHLFLSLSQWLDARCLELSVQVISRRPAMSVLFLRHERCKALCATPDAKSVPAFPFLLRLRQLIRDLSHKCQIQSYDCVFELSVAKCQVTLQDGMDICCKAIQGKCIQAPCIPHYSSQGEPASLPGLALPQTVL
jgi:hypothetical protein